MHVLRLFDSPVEYFRDRLHAPPRWLVAVSMLLVAMAVDTASGFVLVNRLVAEHQVNAPEAIANVMSAVGIVSAVSVFAFFFWIVALAAVMADFAYLQSGRAHRFVECTALAYVALLPWGLVKLWIVLYWQPVDIGLTLYMFRVVDWFAYLWIAALVGGAVYAGGHPKPREDYA